MELSRLVDFNLPFVVYKKPQSARLKIIKQVNDQIYKDDQLSTNGFYFYPFDNKKNNTIVFPDKFSSKEDYLIRNLNFDFSNEKVTYQIIQLKETQSLHIKKVALAIDYIKENKGLKKLVISSRLNVEVNDFNWQNTLLNLMNQYENSMVWIWHHPKIGTWMGATPEVLGVFKKEMFKTISLAGTLPVEKDKVLIWSGKEIEEQQLVTDYIRNKIMEFSKSVEVGMPKTVYQGKIAHIQTEIQTQINFKKALEVILALHPTPAVCGIPAEKSRYIIQKIENYNRKYYTGFLGIKNADAIQFFVNLRSMEIKKHNFINIYVGGGILSNSKPEKEWKEIYNKSQILLNYLMK